VPEFLILALLRGAGTLSEDAEHGFDCFSALRKAIKKARTIEIADARNTRRIGLRLKVRPVA
jgi:hypothetical protein